MLKLDYSKIYLTSDHAGYKYRKKLGRYLMDKYKIQVVDLGPKDTASVSYADFGLSGAKTVIENSNSIGIFICGTGAGICAAAGKVGGVMAINIASRKLAKMAKLHNNANIICFGQRTVPLWRVKWYLKIFFKTKFEGGRHEERSNTVKNSKSV